MTLIYAALAIGLLSLDTTHVLQVLVSQPIFGCTIIGSLLGDTLTGAEIGCMMQLLWLNTPPIGAVTFPEGNVASMVVCALIILFPLPGLENLAFTAAVFVGLLISYIGSRVTILDRKINVQFLEMALKAADQGRIDKMKYFQIGSVTIYLILMTLLAYLAIQSGGLLINWLSTVASSGVESKLAPVKSLLWGIGFALAGYMFLESLHLKRR